MKRFAAGVLVALLLLAGVATSRAADWKFLVYGDTRSSDSVHVALVDRMVQEKADLVLNTGDLVPRGRYPEQWANFFRIIAPLQKVSTYYPVRGNHDFGMDYLDNYEMSRDGLPHFDVPRPRPGVFYYAFTHKNAKFIILDPFLRTDPKSIQGEWFRTELEKAKGIPFVFVSFHYPIFNAHPRRPDNEELRANLHDVMRKYRVSVVFNGHDHYYYHTKRQGLIYVITGGGGAHLYDIDQSRLKKGDVGVKAHHYIRCVVGDKRMHVEAIDLDGNIIDSFDVKAR